MKRLFTVNGEHFATKSEAKAARGPAITKEIPADPHTFGSKTIPPTYKHTIQYGPDHWKRGGSTDMVALKPVAVKRVRRKAAAS